MVYGDIYNPKDTIYTATLNNYSDKIQQLEKENASLKEQLIQDVRDQKEIADLKQQLSLEQLCVETYKTKLDSIKTLSRQEVEKIIFNNIKIDDNFYGVKDAITAICNLALKIDRDKIIQVFAKYACFCGLDNDFGEVKISGDEFYELLADEIISAIGSK